MKLRPLLQELRTAGQPEHWASASLADTRQDRFALQAWHATARTLPRCPSAAKALPHARALAAQAASYTPLHQDSARQLAKARAVIAAIVATITAATNGQTRTWR